jgi:hypothetical protein
MMQMPQFQVQVQELGISILYITTMLPLLRSSEDRLKLYLKSISATIESEASVSMTNFFSSEHSTESLEKLCLDNLNGILPAKFRNLEKVQRQQVIKSKIKHPLNEFILHHCAAFSLADGELTGGKVQVLFDISNDLGIEKARAISIFKNVFKSEDRLLAMARAQSQYSQIICYLYALKSCLVSDKILDHSEKKVLNMLKRELSLNIGVENFWQQYLDLLEGSRKEFEFIQGQEELTLVFAAFNLIAFEDGNLHRQEVDFIKNLITRFGIKKFELEDIRKYTGMSIEEIMGRLSAKTKVFLVIKTLMLSFEDSNFHENEEIALEKILTEIRKSEGTVKDCKDLYLLFLHFAIQTPNVLNHKQGAFFESLHDKLRALVGFDGDLKKVLFIISSFHQIRGGTATDTYLIRLFNHCGIPSEEARALARDCLEDRGVEYQKSLLIISLLKAELLLKQSSPRPDFIGNFREVVRQLPYPGTNERHILSYFVLKSLLLDESMQDEEIRFFDELVFNLKIDQSTIYRYIAYLYLETSVRHNFSGWIDYSEFLSKKQRRLSHFKLIS